jgi:hypothetical protein
MNKKLIIKLFRYVAIFGNVVFVLWVLYNAMDEGFRGTIYEMLSGIGLILLLSLNIVLLSLG